MDRNQKKQLVAHLNSNVFALDTVLVVHYHGLTVAAITKLRKELRSNGAKFVVTKNSLAKRATLGTTYEQLGDLLSGPTAFAYSEDPVSVAKVLVEFAKTNEKLALIGGVVQNSFIDVEGIKTLASLPSLDELRAKIIGLINAPATKLARVIQTPAQMLVTVLKAYSEK